MEHYTRVLSKWMAFCESVNWNSPFINELQSWRTKREKSKNPTIHSRLTKFLVAIKNSAFSLLRMVICLQYTEECYASRICLANNTVVIRKEQLIHKILCFPNHNEKYSLCCNSQNWYQQTHTLWQTLMVLIHSLTIYTLLLLKPLWPTAEEVVLLCSPTASLEVSY